MTLADDLRAARALIDDEDNWYQGRSRSPDNDECVCIVTAFSDACGYDSEAMKFTERLVDATRYPEERYYKRTLAVFNDDPATTHADIMALFDRAIAKAEQA